MGHPRELPKLSRRAQLGDTLVAALGARTLEPGASYSPAVLASQLGVPSESVHEAMIDLAAEGLVEATGNGDFRISNPTVAELREMIELRLLIEIPAVRKVTDEGLSDQEFTTLRRLALATMTAAQDEHTLAYINADLVFHLYLLSLADNRELVEVVRVLRSRSRLHGLRDEDSAPFMLNSARDHLDLVQMVSDGRGSAVDDLLRHHLAFITASWPEHAEPSP